ncbi:hypothetical protein BGZ76_006698 [Entomortierella beljakovae]|nr:hypothetical protein BGZ76_006698 [Entomortierella beljakovae]
MINTRGKNKSIVFGGTDYGVVKLSETCTFSHAEIEWHINKYQVLAGLSDSDIGEPPCDQSVPRISNKITSKNIHEISFVRRIENTRRHRLRKPNNEKSRQALANLSNKEQVLKTAGNLKSIDIARKKQLEARPELLKFEADPKRIRDQHTIEIRTRRAWASLASSERRFVTDNASSSKIKGTDVASFI